MQRATGQTDQAGSVRQGRANIARVKTVLRETGDAAAQKK